MDLLRPPPRSAIPVFTARSPVWARWKTRTMESAGKAEENKRHRIRSDGGGHRNEVPFLHTSLGRPLSADRKPSLALRVKTGYPKTTLIFPKENQHVEISSPLPSAAVLLRSRHTACRCRRPSRWRRFIDTAVPDDPTGRRPGFAGRHRHHRAGRLLRDGPASPLRQGECADHIPGR